MKKIVDYKRLDYVVKQDLSAVTDWSPGIFVVCRRIAKKRGCLSDYVYRRYRAMKLSGGARERLLRKFETMPNGCIRWIGGEGESRRIAIRLHGCPRGTRFVYRVEGNKWTAVMSCGNEWCHNPEHGRLTTTAEVQNKKHIIAAEIRHGVNLLDVASRHNLSPERVYQIMSEMKPGLTSKKWIATGPSYKERALKELRSANGKNI